MHLNVLNFSLRILDWKCVSSSVTIDNIVAIGALIVGVFTFLFGAYVHVMSARLAKEKDYAKSLEDKNKALVSQMIQKDEDLSSVQRSLKEIETRLLLEPQPVEPREGDDGDTEISEKHAQSAQADYLGSLSADQMYENFDAYLRFHNSDQLTKLQRKRTGETSVGSKVVWLLEIFSIDDISDSFEFKDGRFLKVLTCSSVNPLPPVVVVSYYDASYEKLLLSLKQGDLVHVSGTIASHKFCVTLEDADIGLARHA